MLCVCVWCVCMCGVVGVFVCVLRIFLGEGFLCCVCVSGVWVVGAC